MSNIDDVLPLHCLEHVVCGALIALAMGPIDAVLLHGWLWSGLWVSIVVVPLLGWSKAMLTDKYWPSVWCTIGGGFIGAAISWSWVWWLAMFLNGKA